MADAGVNPKAFDTFYQEYRQQSMSSKRDYARAYQRFYDEQHRAITIEECILGREEIDKWEQALLNYFRYEVKAGAVYLVLLASSYWQSLKDNRSDMVGRSVLDTPLFKPLIHDTGDLNHFDKNTIFLNGSIACRTAYRIAGFPVCNLITRSCLIQWRKSE